MPRRAVLALSVLVATLLSACDPIQQGDVAVRAHGAYVLARVVPCAEFGDFRVTAIELFADPRSEPLWRVRTETPREVAAFVVGVAPPGFHEEIPLLAAPERGPEFGLVVSNPGGHFLLNAFHVPELRSDQWLTWNNEFVTDRELAARAKCK